MDNIISLLEDLGILPKQQLVSPEAPPNVIGTPSQMKMSVKYNPNLGNQVTAPAQYIPQPFKVNPAAVIDPFVKQIFGNQYTNWYRAMNGENGSHDPTREYHNDDGSVDRGIMQINSNTFNDFLRRKGDMMKQMGINTFNDMFDPLKNIKMGKLIYDEQGWNAWHGAPADLKK